MRLSTESVARAASRRPWTTIAVWIVAIVVAGALSATWLADALTTGADFTNRPESVQAEELVEERYGEEGLTELLIVSAPGKTLEDAGFKAGVRRIQAAALETEGVVSAVTFYDTKDPSMVSKDGRITLVPVTFKEIDNVGDYEEPLEEIMSAAQGFEVTPFGSITINGDFSEIAERDLREGERFGLLVAIVVLLLVFGAVVAGVIPILMGIASIAIAMGLVALAGRAFEFSFFVTNMISMMGLAVGIDYSLFIVSRYREERHGGREKLDAIRAAGATASRAVFFSGMTVVLALVGMLIIPTTIFRSLAAGAIFVVVVAVLASLTLLPALLGLLGDRVNALRVFRRKDATGQLADSHRFWDRITHSVMRRPWTALVLSAGLLLLAAFSYLDINTGFSGVSSLPKNTESRQAFEVLQREFAAGQNSPVEIVVDGDIRSPQVGGAIKSLRRELAADPLFGPAQVIPAADGDAAIVSVSLRTDPFSIRATDSIERIREEYVPAAFEGTSARVLVGGETAFNKDFFDLTDRYTPIVFTFVLGLSLVLLTIVFRSIVVPIKAIIMNLLSVGAAYGLVVLVFQKGFAADLLGFQTVETVEAWLPLFLFSILFGLSMDYHVFLLSRIREHFDRTGDNTESVAHGLRTTGALITGAAAIMVAVFGGFAMGDLVMMQQMGFGLAIAVLLDATIVRSVLVPATMRLLGERNWYLPKWLRWLPELHVEGPHDGGRTAAPVEPEKAPATV